MRFCPTFWPLPNENFVEGNLDREHLHNMLCGMGVVFHAGT